MATAERPLTPADDRAWDLFFEALDADSPTAERIPPGAAIVAADIPDRAELLRRYHRDHRSVVIVDEDGRTETLRPHQIDRGLLLGALAVFAALLWRAATKAGR